MRHLLRPPLAGCAVLAITLAVSGTARADAPPVALPVRLDPMAGPAATGLMIQSAEPVADLNLLADLWLLGTARWPVGILRHGVPSHAAASMYLPAEITLSPGDYGVHVQSDGAIAAMQRTDWPATGAATAMRSAVPATDVVVPLVALAHYGQTSRIAVQNARGDVEATVDLSYHAAGRTGAVATERLVVPRGQTAVVEPPAHLATGPAGFLGTLRATSAVSIAVQAHVAIAGSQRAVYDVAGVPAAGASDVLYAPVVRRVLGTGSAVASSALVVANAGDAPAVVSVAYRGRHGACTGQAIDHDPVTVPPRSSRVVYQGADHGLPDKNHLPDGCIASAVVRSDGAPLAAVVVDVVAGGWMRASSYAAIPAGATDRQVAVPLVRRCFPSRVNLLTGVTLMNTGTATAHVQPEGYDLSARPLFTCGAACGIRIAPGDAYVFTLQGPASCQPDGSSAVVGAAFFSADQPLAVVAHEVADHGQLDDVGFDGIPAGEAHRTLRAWFPLAPGGTAP